MEPMTLEELTENLAALDRFTRELYESVVTINTQLHSLAHKVLEVEAEIEKSKNPFNLPKGF